MTVALSVLTRGCSLVIALLCGVLTARLVLGHAGVPYYALYTLITALPTLISFSDLGSGAAVVNAAATSPAPSRDPELRVTVTSVGRIMLGFAGVGVVANCVLLVSGGWQTILGDAGRLPGAPWCAFVALCLFCAGIPLGIWQRIMLGLGKNHVIILVQLFQGPLNLGLVYCVVLGAGPSGYSFIALSSMVAALIVSLTGFGLVWHRTRPLLRHSGFDLLRFRGVRSVPVMDVGWPMLAQLLATPISLTLQRYLLAQFLPASEVAVYASAGQVFLAVSALISAGGVALWPAFTRARRRGEVIRGPWLISGVFAVAAAAVCACVVIVSPWLFAFITSGRLVIPMAVLLWFSAMVTAQGALYPLGMFIMDRPGIRFQVAPSLLMALATALLSLVVIPLWGVAGPLAANTVAVITLQIVPYTLYIHHHRERLRSDPVSESVPMNEPR